MASPQYSPYAPAQQHPQQFQQQPDHLQYQGGPPQQPQTQHYPQTYQQQPQQPFQQHPQPQPQHQQFAQFQPQQPPQQNTPNADSRESYQTVLPPTVTPGWNDPPPILGVAGTTPNRLTNANMRRRPVDPSISCSGASPAGYGVAQTGYSSPYGGQNQPQQQQQQQNANPYHQQQTGAAPNSYGYGSAAPSQNYQSYGGQQQVPHQQIPHQQHQQQYHPQQYQPQQNQPYANSGPTMSM